MIKLRNAGYCNLKLLLIYLVIYGHWIENDIYDCEYSLTQYRIIYMFHMPLFIFLAGLFLKSSDDCICQIRRTFPMYVLCQAIALLNDRTNVSTPWWSLWFLLSYCFWVMFGWIWFRFEAKISKWLVIVIAVLIGGLAGYMPWLDRTWSGARTIVFFPYFFAGLICSPNIQWQKYRRLGLAAFAIATGGIFFWGNRIPVAFLYQAAPFGALEDGLVLRLLCYCIGGLLGFFLLTITPQKRFPFTRAGADTMPAYLIHAPAMLHLRELHLSWTQRAVLSAFLLYIIYKILQWSSKLYGIIPEKRRGRGVWISGDL